MVSRYFNSIVHSAQCTYTRNQKPSINREENAIVYSNNIILTPFSIQWFFCRRRHHRRNTNTCSTLHFVGFFCAVAQSFIEKKNILNSFQCMSFHFGLFVFTVHSFPMLNLDAHSDWIELFSTISFLSLVIQRRPFWILGVYIRLWYFYDMNNILLDFKWNLNYFHSQRNLLN